MINLKILPAQKTDTDTILKLYHAAIGSPGCTWNSEYPSLSEICGDIDAGCLYIGVAEKKIIGAASIVPDNELDHLPIWHVCTGKQRELARVTVLPEYRGHGYAYEILQHLLALLEKNDCPAVHLLVAKKNECAVRLYRKLGFLFVGDCHMYGNDYYACEKLLGAWSDG